MNDLAVIRRSLLALLYLGFIGTIAELLLSEHTEDIWQLVPVALLVAGTVLLGSGAAWKRPARIRLFQGLMALFVVSGLIGSGLHYKAKTEFALERSPALHGTALLREALKGKNPPLLAPGAMIALGLLGLTWTYRHPDLNRTQGVAP